MDIEEEVSILEHDCSKVLTLSGEKIYLVIKQHFITIIPSLLLIFFLAWFFLLIGTVIMVLYKELILLSSIFMLLTISTALGLFAQTLINWYFHMYIVTSKKLLEIHYSPISSHIASEILLDRVKCTEVDMRTEGLIYQFLDIGSVSITFDRPTHQQEYIISSIKNYRVVGALMANKFIRSTTENPSKPQDRWFKDKDSDRYIYTEDFERPPIQT